MGLPRSSTLRSSMNEWPVQISHGGSQGFKSPHLHITTALVPGLAGHLRRAQRITGGLVSHWQAKARPADSSRRPAAGVTLTEAIPAVHWSVRRRIGAVRVARLRASFGGSHQLRSWIGSGDGLGQTTGSRRLVRSGDALSAGLSEAGWPGVGLAQVSTGAGTSTSAGLARITTSDTTSASTAKTAASWKAVEMPWASTWWAYCAGS